MNCHHLLASKELGGAALVALQLAEHLQRRGRRQLVWLPGGGPAMDEANRRSLDARPYKGAQVFSRRRAVAAVGNVRMSWSLRGKAGGVAHVHSPHLYGALSVAIRLSGLLRVLHIQLAEDPVGLRCTLRRPPDLIITCARTLIGGIREALPERHRRRQWIEAVPNPVDIHRFTPAADKVAAKRRVGAPADAPLALMLANLAPHKGQETAIRAVAELQRREVPLICWMAGVERGGGGSYAAYLRSLVEGLDLRDRVRLLGHRDDAPDLLRAADAMLLPSTNEGLPLSILEAQASGVPVLAAPTDGIPEVVVDGRTGFLIRADDVRGYADRLATLISDPGLAERVAKAACARARSDSSLSVYCERVETLYRELLERTSRAPAPWPNGRQRVSRSTGRS